MIAHQREALRRLAQQWRNLSGYDAIIQVTSSPGLHVGNISGVTLAYNRSFRTTGTAVVTGCMFAIASTTIAAAATIEEVAHCRAIPQLTERLNCFKSLKPGPRAKTQAAAPAMKQHAGVPKVKDNSPANAKQTAPAKTPAKAEQAAPTKTAAEPPKTDEAAPPKKGEAAPAKTETTTQSNAGEGLSPAQNDPATTSSIDRLSFAHEQPLCEGRDNLVAMIVAGLLTSDPSQALTPGCQAIPDDAKLELLERSPSVFPFMRVIKVKVTSPTQPDLTSGFTIEMGR